MFVYLEAGKINDRAASVILIPTINALRQKHEEYGINYSSMRRTKTKKPQDIGRTF